MREFRPPVRPSAFRLILAVLLPALVIVPMVALASITLGITHATYTIGEGSLRVRSGDLFAGILQSTGSLSLNELITHDALSNTPMSVQASRANVDQPFTREAPRPVGPWAYCRTA